MNASIVVLYASKPHCPEPTNCVRYRFCTNMLTKMLDWRVIPPIEIRNVVYSAFLLNYELYNTERLHISIPWSKQCSENYLKHTDCNLY